MPAADEARKADSIFFDPNQIYHVWNYQQSSSFQNLFFECKIYEEVDVEDNFTISLNRLFDIIAQDEVSYVELSEHGKKNLRAKLNKIKDSLSNTGAPIINVQPTTDGSAMFSFTINGINFYLEYFVNYLVDEMEEAVITAFDGNEMIIDFSGSLEDAYTEVVNKTTDFSNNITINNASGISTDLIAEAELSLY